MQSFWAIIRFAFFLSDWFIAHSNVLKGLTHSMNRFEFKAIWKTQGCGDSATQPGTAGMLSANCCTSQQPELQKLVSKCQKFPTEQGAEHACPVQSCRMSIFSHPVQISQYGTILHLRCHPWQQITRIMVNGKKKTTNKQNRERCQVLTSVYFLSYHSLKLLPNAIK